MLIVDQLDHPDGVAALRKALVLDQVILFYVPGKAMMVMQTAATALLCLVILAVPSTDSAWRPGFSQIPRRSKF